MAIRRRRDFCSSDFPVAAAGRVAGMVIVHPAGQREHVMAVDRRFLAGGNEKFRGLWVL
jgi:hypothetical protein